MPFLWAQLLGLALVGLLWGISHFPVRELPKGPLIAIIFMSLAIGVVNALLGSDGLERSLRFLALSLCALLFAARTREENVAAELQSLLGPVPFVKEQEVALSAQLAMTYIAQIGTLRRKATLALKSRGLSNHHFARAATTKMQIFLFFASAQSSRSILTLEARGVDFLSRPARNMQRRDAIAIISCLAIFAGSLLLTIRPFR